MLRIGLNSLSTSSRSPVIFMRKLNTETSPVNPQNWKTHETLMYYESPNIVHSPKIACFGFNKCLVTTSLYQRGPDAWRLRYTDIPQKLKELHDNGYKLVVFCNQSFIGQAQDPEAKERAIVHQTARIGGMMELIQLPFQIFVATGRTARRSELPIVDKFRKPAPGMWNFLIAHCNGGIPPEISSCFYVGGAAGRPRVPGRRADHSDYDIKFAENAGIKFITDEDYFGLDSKQKGPPAKPKTKEEELEELALKESKAKAKEAKLKDLQMKELKIKAKKEVKDVEVEVGEVVKEAKKRVKKEKPQKFAEE